MDIVKKPTLKAREGIPSVVREICNCDAGDGCASESAESTEEYPAVHSMIVWAFGRRQNRVATRSFPAVRVFATSAGSHLCGDSPRARPARSPSGCRRAAVDRMTALAG
jgi:hypothetical protein